VKKNLASALAKDGDLRDFDPEPDIQISLACLSLEALVKDQSSKRLVRKNRAAHGALPGKLPLSAERRKICAGKVEHECRAALLAAQLQAAEFRIGYRKLFLAHGATILGEQTAESNWFGLAGLAV
jgi:hypothetical protein